MNQFELFDCVKNLDSYPRSEQIGILERLAFDFYLRKGFIPDWVAKLRRIAAAVPLGYKFNPYHDPSNGRFTFGPDDGDGDDTTPDDNGDNGGDTSTPGDRPGRGDGIWKLPDEPARAIPVSDSNNDRPNAQNVGSVSQPAENLSTSQQGIDFIKQREGFSPTVYLDNAGKATIGYGHKLGPNESYPNGITQSEAEQLLVEDIGKSESTVQNSVSVNLTQNQFDALVSLTYNIGSDNFETSTLLRLLNQGNYNGAANQFPAWNKITMDGVKKPNAGLTNRRYIERDLFLNGNY